MPIFLLTSFLREVQYNSYSYFFIGKIPPPLGIFQDFLFAFEFLQFYYAVHRCEFFGIYPAWYSLCFPNLWFSLCHSFWKILCHYYFKYFFLFLFSSASGFPLHVCYTFSNFPRVFGYSVSFFIPFSLYMSVLEVSVDIFRLTDCPLDHIQSTNELIKGSLHYFYRVFISSTYFLFFFRVSISLLTFSICFCMLPAYYIRILHTLIIITLNSWDYSKISAISESFLLCLLILLAFLFTFVESWI